MDSTSQLIFITDVKAQMETLRRAAQRLEDSATGLSDDDIVWMESVAYQIHNFYNAAEDLLKLVVVHFENNIASLVNGIQLFCEE